MRRSSVAILVRMALLGSATSVGAGCAVHAAPPSVPERELTAGLVQRDVHAGASATEVANALGSPNIVTRDAEGTEVWIYDRVSSERVERSVSGATAGLFPVGAGLVGATGSASQNELRTSQRTLTVVIRFDQAGRVTAVNFHATRF